MVHSAPRRSPPVCSARPAPQVRTCRLPAAPPCLLEVLTDPAITLVGYSWDGADQAKLAATYGWGRERFARWHDLQQVRVRGGAGAAVGAGSAGAAE